MLTMKKMVGSPLWSPSYDMVAYGLAEQIEQLHWLKQEIHFTEPVCHWKTADMLCGLCVVVMLAIERDFTLLLPKNLHGWSSQTPW